MNTLASSNRLLTPLELSNYPRQASPPPPPPPPSRKLSILKTTTLNTARNLPLARSASKRASRTLSLTRSQSKNSRRASFHEAFQTMAPSRLYRRVTGSDSQSAKPSSEKSKPNVGSNHGDPAYIAAQTATHRAKNPPSRIPTPVFLPNATPTRPRQVISRSTSYYNRLDTMAGNRTTSTLPKSKTMGGLPSTGTGMSSTMDSYPRSEPIQVNERGNHFQDAYDMRPQTPPYGKLFKESDMDITRPTTARLARGDKIGRESLSNRSGDVNPRSSIKRVSLPSTGASKDRQFLLGASKESISLDRNPKAKANIGSADQMMKLKSANNPLDTSLESFGESRDEVKSIQSKGNSAGKLKTSATNFRKDKSPGRVMEDENTSPKKGAVAQRQLMQPIPPGLPRSQMLGNILACGSNNTCGRASSEQEYHFPQERFYAKINRMNALRAATDSNVPSGSGVKELTSNMSLLSTGSAYKTAAEDMYVSTLSDASQVNTTKDTTLSTNYSFPPLQRVSSSTTRNYLDLNPDWNKSTISLDFNDSDLDDMPFGFNRSKGKQKVPPITSPEDDFSPEKWVIIDGRQYLMVARAMEFPYWAGRFMALSDRFRAEDNAGATARGERSQLAVLQRAAETPEAERARTLRVFRFLQTLCMNSEARDSLHRFWTEYAARYGGQGPVMANLMTTMSNVSGRFASGSANDNTKGKGKKESQGEKGREVSFARSGKSPAAAKGDKDDGKAEKDTQGAKGSVAKGKEVVNRFFRRSFGGSSGSKDGELKKDD